jgi:exoribonuclease-2
VNLLFEEDGTIKAGSVLSATDSSFQVELPSGKRAKVKGSHVLMRFDEPAAARMLERAGAEAEAIDLDFLWEAAPQDEFSFQDLAQDYFGGQPSSIQQAALLLRLHSAPVYFYRKGRGRYRPALPEALQAALAAVERRRRQDELRQHYVDQLKARQTPAAIASQAVSLLIKPDRNSLEYKAIEQAANETQTTPLRLLLATGAIESPYRWHVDSFLAQHFPRGAAFPADLPQPSLSDAPLATVEAFSIDDSATTEIDDAFSVVWQTGERARIGIHIAAPASEIDRTHPLDAVARQRMSTVYAPGFKLTMLPSPWIDAYSLTEGREVPVLSLYVDIDTGSHAVLAMQTRVERVRIAANLRHDRLDSVITDDAIASGDLDVRFASELSLLWRFARTLLAAREAARGRKEPLGRVDYSFDIDGEGEQSRVLIRARRRGAPLDLLVAELMILANSTWGRWLAERGTAGIYRSQALGRVRMSTSPAAHEGIGVTHYAWSTSPLRRYVDLVNQRQLISCVVERAPPYSSRDADLYGIVSGFDAAYGAYAEFQEKMERYWGLRWIRQETIQRIGASVIRGDVLRLAGLPFVTRLPGLPELPRGQQLELDIIGGDELDLTLQARVHRVCSGEVLATVDDDDVVAAIEQPPMTAAPTDDDGTSTPQAESDQSGPR